MQHQPVIFLNGTRIYLRPIETQDLPLFQRWINDPKIRPLLLRQMPLDAIGEQQWYESRSRIPYPTDIVMGIVRKRDHRLIGSTGIHGMNWISRNGTTGAVIGEKNCWNKGYGSEAKQLMLRYCFDTLGLHRISSSVHASNVRSLAYLKKCGYREEGLRREQVFCDGQWLDVIDLGILASDWRAAQQKKKR